MSVGLGLRNGLGNLGCLLQLPSNSLKKKKRQPSPTDESLAKEKKKKRKEKNPTKTNNNQNERVLSLGTKSALFTHETSGWKCFSATTSRSAKARPISPAWKQSLSIMQTGPGSGLRSAAPSVRQGAFRWLTGGWRVARRWPRRSRSNRVDRPR